MHLLLAAALTAVATGPLPLPRPTVRLVWSDPLRVLPRGVDEVEQEVREAFRPAGVAIAWRVAAGEAASGDELNVVLLPSEPARRSPRETMGEVVVGRRQVLWIFAAPVRRALGLMASGSLLASPAERLDFPRALARVLAHELVHAVLPERPHSRVGLMRASLDKGFLTGAMVTIDDGTLKAFGERVSRVHSEFPAATTELLERIAR